MEEESPGVRETDQFQEMVGTVAEDSTLVLMRKSVNWLRMVSLQESYLPTATSTLLYC